MPGPQVDQIIRDIIKTLPGVQNLDAAVDKVRAGYDLLLPGLSANLAREFAEARETVARKFAQIEIIHRRSIIRPRPQWYFGPLPGQHWIALESYLRDVKQWPTDEIDEASTEVVSLLEDPSQPTFDGRGLVVGHVQSGKTANMTAVIAKALDAGYNTVIVLAGMTNKLRHQTQSRLIEDIVDRNPESWQVLTPNEMDGDFRAPAHGGFLSHVDKAQLAVVKKNVSPLGELQEAVKRTLPVTLRRLRVLVIDDECDQASVKAPRNELDVPAINQHIRELLAAFPAVTYVGYTATPFANVLINPYRSDRLDLDDLYPRDFMTALDAAPGYFGTERLFGRIPADANNIQPEEEGLNVIRSVPQADASSLQPRSQRDRHRFHPSMPDTLKASILYFLACCSARRARGHLLEHMTMLVHTSAYVAAHNKVAGLIEGWVDLHRSDIVDRKSEIGRLLETTWSNEQGKLPDDITTARPVSIEEIFANLPSVLAAVKFPVENGASDDRIDYDKRYPRTYIVVGGSILSRGLTLQGLMVSYFLRTANQYDTLLQMGRWFGFREGYEDLPRVWMPDDLKNGFRALAGIEDEVREQIRQYKKSGLTPMELAISIRSIPGMAITAAAKMRAARPCAVSYWGTHKQTTRFHHKDEETLRANWDAASELVSRASALDLRDQAAAKRGLKLWRGVPLSSILRFFGAYETHEGQVDLRQDFLATFLANGDHRLEKWNVGVVEAARGKNSPQELGTPGSVAMVNRARLKGDDTTADIKAIMSKGDLRIDCPPEVPADADWDVIKSARLRTVGQIPLLLLYPIDRDSLPQRESEVRGPLAADYEILGYGIVFPGSVLEGGNSVSVQLRPLSADQIEELDAEEQAQSEAAGVR